MRRTLGRPCVVLALALGAWWFAVGIAAAGPSQEDRIAEAKRLLAEAGFPEGKGFPKVELLYNTSEAHKSVAAVLQNMWHENLGVDVELRNTEWKVYLDQLTQLDYQLARRGWIGDYVDPNTFIELFTSSSGNNNTGWKNVEYDKLVEAAGRETEKAKRFQLLAAAERLLLDEAPILPIYFYVSQNMYRDEVKGWYPNLQNVHPMNELVKGDGSGRLVINNDAEVQTIDPGLARGVPEHRVDLALFEGLLNWHPRTLAPIPGVAETFDVSPDGKVYTFHLRACAWSDGKPLTAGDFVYAWRRVVDPKTASDYAHQLYYVKNGKAVNEGKAKLEELGVQAKDERTLVVELENPTAFFPLLMPFATYTPVRQDVVEKHGKEWTQPGKFVGNGPFQLKEWVKNSHLAVEPNPNYWNARQVKQKEIRFLPVDDAATALTMYDQKQCDVLVTVPLDQIDAILKRPDFHTDTYLGTYFYSFNVTKPPFNDKRVRRAFALAFDRKVVCEDIMRGGQQPAWSVCPPVFEGYSAPRLSE
ncbi:MAG: hypothetical protein HYZ53_04610 [Planctomycetes bacterium]|nr:hypothetical protein [Planctomycetota bacterium]